MAIIIGVAGVGLAASVRELGAHAQGYGTAWDAAVTEVGLPYLDPANFKTAMRAVRGSDDVGPRVVSRCMKGASNGSTSPSLASGRSTVRDSPGR